MVRAGRIATHRRLGVIGAVIGAAVVIAGPMASLGVPGRVTAAGLDWNLDVSVAIPYVGVEGVTLIAFVANVVWNNLVSIVLFAGLLTAAILLRSNAQAHKRLIVIASMLNVLPAAARISRWQGAWRRGQSVHPGGAHWLAAVRARVRHRDAAAPAQSDAERHRSHRGQRLATPSRKCR